MKVNSQFSLIIISVGFLLNQPSPSGACETERQQNERLSPPPQTEHHPWLKIHLGKPLKNDTTPPPRQKVDIFGKNPVFFTGDERMYFIPSNTSTKTNGTQGNGTD